VKPQEMDHSNNSFYDRSYEIPQKHDAQEWAAKNTVDCELSYQKALAASFTGIHRLCISYAQILVINPNHNVYKS